MHHQPLLLVQVGSPPDDIRAAEGDLLEWFQRLLGKMAEDMEVVRVFEGETLPEPGQHRAAIISGSWAMVTDRLDWSEATADWIRRAMAIDMPMFGVCYGHQLMSHALGGEVGYHPDGREVGCQQIELMSDAAHDPLCRDLPQQFRAHLTHLQTVLKPPPNAVVLAQSAHDAHQMLRYGPRAMSTQFHPEFTLQISKAFVMQRAEVLRKEGFDLEALAKDLRDTPIPAQLLLSFLQALSDERQKTMQVDACDGAEK